MRKPLILFIPIIRKKFESKVFVPSVPFTMECVRWHNALIDYFISKKDFCFIWKHAPQSDDNTIYKTLRDKKAKNIKFDTRPMRKWLLRVDKAICDCPSTGFFECIWSGVPTIALYTKNQDLPEEANVTFGECLQFYSTIAEGLAAIDKFLECDRKYIVKLPLTKEQKDAQTYFSKKEFY